jgi:hypothetical protein
VKNTELPSVMIGDSFAREELVTCTGLGASSSLFPGVLSTAVTIKVMVITTAAVKVTGLQPKRRILDPESFVVDTSCVSVNGPASERLRAA